MNGVLGMDKAIPVLGLLLSLVFFGSGLYWMAEAQSASGSFAATMITSLSFICIAGFAAEISFGKRR